MTEQLTIERLGARGEGLARINGKLVFVPYALAGETVLAEVEGDNARLESIVEASPDRIAPICEYYGLCGGCAVQTLAPPAYAEWKRGLVVSALRNAGLEMEVAPLIDAHGGGRRRATFHARFEQGTASLPARNAGEPGGSRSENGVAQVGFMRARAHDIIEIAACPLLDPALAGVLEAARALARALAKRAKPLDIVAAATLQGLDIDLRGAGPLEESESAALIDAAKAHRLVRLSNHGRLVFANAAPQIAVGETAVAAPPGVFLQATQKGEETIAALVMDAAKRAKRVADLFCGLGAFALRLAARANVAAYDSDVTAIAALKEAADRATGLRPLTAAARDLFRRPLSQNELEAFDAIVFDPPRAGAEAQARQITKAKTRTVIAVSCNAQSFARDAAILIEGGYLPRSVTPIDQFRYSAHVEIVAVFEHEAHGPGRKRPLLR